MRNKPSCKASKEHRPVLYRAGDIAERLFCTFQRYTWTWPIERVEKERIKNIGDVWRVSDGEKAGGSYFVPFPDALFSDVNDQKAILCHGRSNDALAFLHTLMRDLLKGESWFLYAEGLTCKNC